MMKPDSYRLLYNSRFYILASSLLLSIIIFAWLRLQISSDQLFYIRTQQVFGLICILYWYLALIISPIGHIIGKQRTNHLAFARRAIGISACYFALLHGSLALWGQLGGLTQLAYLPTLFKWSLLLGGIALSILLVMAATSFDRVIRFMTIRKWKWLHRLVYIGGILAVLHVWSVGTHLAYTGVQISAFIALALLSGLEILMTLRLLNARRFHLRNTELYCLIVALWSLVCIGILLIPSVVQNYHSRHNESTNSQHTGGGHQ